MGLGPVAAAGFVALLIVALAVLVGARGPASSSASAAAALLAFDRDDRRVLDDHRPARHAADPRVEPDLDLHRVLRVSRGRRRARPPSAAVSGRSRSGGPPSRGARCGARVRALQPDHLRPRAALRARELVRGRPAVRLRDRPAAPRGAAVFQLPYLPFPEGGQQAGLYENDLLRGYLHSDDLRWSFGATKAGRGVGRRPRRAADGDRARCGRGAGFAGLYVDRFGYQDGGRALESEARRQGRRRAARQRVGPARSSTSGRTPGASRRSTRRKTSPRFARRCSSRSASRRAGSCWNGPGRTVSGSPGRMLRTPSCGSSILEHGDALFGALLDRVGGPPAEVVVTFPGAAPITYRTPAPLQQQLTLPPGETVLRFSTAAPEVPANAWNDQRPHYLLARLESPTRRSARSFPVRARRGCAPAPPRSGGRSRAATALSRAAAVLTPRASPRRTSAKAGCSLIVQG